MFEVKDEFLESLKLFKEVMTGEEYIKLNSLMDKACGNEHGICDPLEVIMSANFYYNCSKLIRDKENVIVVDCGSCIPVWQYFFKGFKKYIAIDSACKFKDLLEPLENAEFISGTIQDKLPEIINNNGGYESYNIVGISNLCVTYFRGDAEIEFNKLKKKITL